jgi:hypothetical protein
MVFDPEAFAAKWFEDHPEVLDKMIQNHETLARIRGDEKTLVSETEDDS